MRSEIRYPAPRRDITEKSKELDMYVRRTDSH